MPVGALSCPGVGADFFLDRIGVMGFARKDGARIELRRAACDLPRAGARCADETDERPAPWLASLPAPGAGKAHGSANPAPDTRVKQCANEHRWQALLLGTHRELGPVVTALLFAGRAGTSITAEIGLMRATINSTRWR